MPERSSRSLTRQNVSCALGGRRWIHLLVLHPVLESVGLLADTAFLISGQQYSAVLWLLTAK